MLNFFTPFPLASLFHVFHFFVPLSAQSGWFFQICIPDYSLSAESSILFNPLNKFLKLLLSIVCQIYWSL